MIYLQYADIQTVQSRLEGIILQRQPIPLSKRPGDIALLAFFLVNILFISYIVDIEQLIIANPYHFTYPIWPPAPAVNAIHWWGSTFDPLQMARPAWWKMTIWIDDLFFGPFYIVAIYAYIRGKEWIRIPSLIYGSTLFTVVLIIMSEEVGGIHATPHLPIVFLANLPWLVFPIYIIYRMWRYPHPFTQEQATEEAPSRAAIEQSSTGSTIGEAG